MPVQVTIAGAVEVHDLHGIIDRRFNAHVARVRVTSDGLVVLDKLHESVVHRFFTWLQMISKQSFEIQLTADGYRVQF